eukprot:jgi/Astpho2/5610/Aster-02862
MLGRLIKNRPCLPSLLLQQARGYQLGVKEVEPWLYSESPLAEAHTPPSSWYQSPLVAETEQQRVWLNSWQYVPHHCHALAEPGSFATMHCFGAPLLFCKDQQNEVKAFHNVCSHHAAEVASGEGRTDVFVCPYHNWTYGLDGRLQQATKLKGIRNFSARDNGLKPVHVEQLGPLWFFHLGKQRPEPIGHTLGQAVPVLKEAGILDVGLTHVASRTYHLNWHVPFAHKDLAASLELEGYSSSLHGPLSLQTAAADPQADSRIGSAAKYGPWLDVNWVTPTSATTCSVLFDYFLDEGVLAIDEKAVAEGLAASNQVQQEDVVLCESVQRGLGSPVYDSGRYGRPEGPMLHFHQHLHKSLMGAN